jgi:hypothetical protein
MKTEHSATNAVQSKRQVGSLEKEAKYSAGWKQHKKSNNLKGFTTIANKMQQHIEYWLKKV